MKKLLLLAAAAAGIGYVMKNRSEQVKAGAAKVASDPRVQSAAAAAQEKVAPVADAVGEKAAPAAPAAAGEKVHGDPLTDPIEQVEAEASDAPDLTPDSAETSHVVDPDKPEAPPVS